MRWMPSLVNQLGNGAEYVFQSSTTRFGHFNLAASRLALCCV
jgi:hypothetical protein